MSLIATLENAFASLILAAPTLPTTVTVLTGIDDDEQVRPCVVCYCSGGEEEPMGTGNRKLDVLISVRGQIEDDADLIAHDALVDLVISTLKIDELAVELSAAAVGLYVFPPVIDTGQSAVVQGRAVFSSQRFSVYCCSAELV